MPSDATHPEMPDWLTRICAGTEMGARVLAHDWGATSIGPPGDWPIGLRTAVGVCLTSRFPMLVVWGPDLVKIYNDAYRPMLGSAKHPRALGAPARDVWPEIWDIIGPMLAEVIDTGVPTWTEDGLLMIERNGFLEECYFVWSYSPLFDADGSVGGVLDVVKETTKEVVSQRRLACLSALSAAVYAAEQVTDVCVRATLALARHNDDIRAADVYLLVGGEPVLIASNRRDEVAYVAVDDLVAVAESRQPKVIGAPADGIGPADQYLVPIGEAHGEVHGVLVTSLNPLRPFDESYADFLHLAGDTVGAALANTYRRAVEVGGYRVISETLQAAMLRPASDLPTVAARYVPAVGNLAVGGDWYDVIDVGPSSRAVVVGDCVGHGLEAATVMAQLRSAARAMLLEGRDPATTLESLDVFARSLPGAFCTSVVCAVFDRSRNVVTYSRAGHPPPLVVGRSGATWLDQGGGLPLAVDTTRRRANASHACDDSDVMILYTDGLVERRGEIIDVGLARLLDAATELQGLSVQQLADGLLTKLLPEPSSDDVVLVVKHVPPAERS